MKSRTKFKILSKAVFAALAFSAASAASTDDAPGYARNGKTLTGNFPSTGITIEAGATVTFAGVYAEYSSDGKKAAVACVGDATIILAPNTRNVASNFVTCSSAIYVPPGHTLTIKGEGYLEAVSVKEYCSAIGACSKWLGMNNNNGRCGNIVIAGGKVTAIAGGAHAAAIGAASYKGTCGDITICGNADVTAVAGYSAAAIGAAGNGGSCGNITIKDNANVKATALAYQYKYNHERYGNNGAGIGGGNDSPCGNIVIATTGRIEAIGAAGRFGGAGIGAGGFSDDSHGCGDCGDIVISNGVIVATGRGEASGIGGSTGAGCGTIRILGGDITATGSKGCAGIGICSTNSAIVIAGGKVLATAGSFEGNLPYWAHTAAGIGASWEGKEIGSITISGGKVEAIGARCCPAIGKAYGGSCKSVTITDGIEEVIARKGSDCKEYIGSNSESKPCAVSIAPSLSQTYSDDKSTLILGHGGGTSSAKGGGGTPASGSVAAASPESEKYMVIDISGGANAKNYPISYLSSVPNGGWGNEYKTSKLVMRYIPAGKFTMGSPTNEPGRGEHEPQHEVTISKPFYMGVFEVTQKQFELVTGRNPSSHRGDTRPVECVNVNDIRGDSRKYNWPATSDVAEDSFVGRIRARTGNTLFDLPTDAQWEYACRAGTTTALNNGTNLTSTDACENTAKVCRYRYNQTDEKGGYRSFHAPAGSYQPNAWGLYDMLGNVWEFCLDWYGPMGDASVADPVGPESGPTRITRGGSWYDKAEYCRSARRGCDTRAGAYDNFGFRLCCGAKPSPSGTSPSTTAAPAAKNPASPAGGNNGQTGGATSTNGGEGGASGNWLCRITFDDSANPLKTEGVADAFVRKGRKGTTERVSGMGDIKWTSAGGDGAVEIPKDWHIALPVPDKLAKEPGHPYSIEMRFRLSALNDWQPLLNMPADNASDALVYVNKGDSRLAIKQHNKAGGSAVYGESGFVVGKDHTLVLNFGANKTTAFLDGKQVFTRECTLAGSYADCSKAGGYFLIHGDDDGEGGTVTFYEVKVYDGAVGATTPAENVGGAENKNSPSDTTSPSPVATPTVNNPPSPVATPTVNNPASPAGGKNGQTAEPSAEVQQTLTSFSEDNGLSAAEKIPALKVYIETHLDEPGIEKLIDLLEKLAKEANDGETLKWVEKIRKKLAEKNSKTDNQGNSGGMNQVRGGPGVMISRLDFETKDHPLRNLFSSPPVLLRDNKTNVIQNPNSYISVGVSIDDGAISLQKNHHLALPIPEILTKEPGHPYSISMKIWPIKTSSCKPLLNMPADNKTGALVYITPIGQIALKQHGKSSGSAIYGDRGFRFVIQTVLLQFDTNRTRIFLDGKEILSHEGPLAGSYADCSKAGGYFLLHGDKDGEDNSITFFDVAVYDGIVDPKKVFGFNLSEDVPLDVKPGGIKPGSGIVWRHRKNGGKRLDWDLPPDQYRILGEISMLRKWFRPSQASPDGGEQEFLACSQNRFDGYFRIEDWLAGKWKMTCGGYDDYMALAIDGKWIFKHPTSSEKVTLNWQATEGIHRFTVVFGDTWGEWGNCIESGMATPIMLDMNDGENTMIFEHFVNEFRVAKDNVDRLCRKSKTRPSAEFKETVGKFVADGGVDAAKKVPALKEYIETHLDEPGIELLIELLEQIAKEANDAETLKWVEEIRKKLADKKSGGVTLEDAGKQGETGGNEPPNVNPADNGNPPATPAQTDPGSTPATPTQTDPGNTPTTPTQTDPGNTPTTNPPATTNPTGGGGDGGKKPSTTGGGGDESQPGGGKKPDEPQEDPPPGETENKPQTKNTPVVVPEELIAEAEAKNLGYWLMISNSVWRSRGMRDDSGKQKTEYTVTPTTHTMLYTNRKGTLSERKWNYHTIGSYSYSCMCEEPPMIGVPGQEFSLNVSYGTPQRTGNLMDEERDVNRICYDYCTVTMALGSRGLPVVKLKTIFHKGLVTSDIARVNILSDDDNLTDNTITFAFPDPSKDSDSVYWKNGVPKLEVFFENRNPNGVALGGGRTHTTWYYKWVPPRDEPKGGYWNLVSNKVERVEKSELNSSRTAYAEAVETTHKVREEYFKNKNDRSIYPPKTERVKVAEFAFASHCSRPPKTGRPGQKFSMRVKYSGVKNDILVEGEDNPLNYEAYMTFRQYGPMRIFHFDGDCYDESKLGSANRQNGLVAGVSTWPTKGLWAVPESKMRLNLRDNTVWCVFPEGPEKADSGRWLEVSYWDQPEPGYGVFDIAKTTWYYEWVPGEESPETQEPPPQEPAEPEEEEQGEAVIKFAQENMALPANKDKFVLKSEDKKKNKVGLDEYRIPFIVLNMPTNRDCKVTFSLRRMGAAGTDGQYLKEDAITNAIPYSVEIVPDPGVKTNFLYEAVVKETGDYELSAGTNEGILMKVTAESGKRGDKDYVKVYETFPIYRIHLGLSLTLQANTIPCYHEMDEKSRYKLDKQDIAGDPEKDPDDKYVIRQEDYTVPMRDGYLMLMLYDEDREDFIRIPAVPKETRVLPTKVANDRYCQTRDAEFDHVALVESLGIKAISTGKRLQSGSHIIKIAPTKAVLDPPLRLLAELEIDAVYSNRVTGLARTFTASREVLLHSQPLRIIETVEDESKYIEEDEHIKKQLQRIMYKIESTCPDRLFSLHDMIERMIDGYDVRFGFDEGQVKKVMETWVGFIEGTFEGANGVPYKVTLADDLKASYAFMQGLRDNTGFLGRMAMGVLTGGISEHVFTTMTVLENMQNEIMTCKDAKEFGFLAAFKIGAEEIGKQVLMEMVAQGAIQGAAKAANIDVNATMQMWAGRYRNAMDGADSWLKSHSGLYKAGDTALQSCKNFLGGGTKAAAKAIENVTRSEGDAAKRAEELLKKSRKDMTPSELSAVKQYEEAMENGMNKVRKLQKAQQAMEDAAKNNQPALKAAKDEYRRLADEVWSDKCALKKLQDVKGDYAKRMRAQFNNYRENLLDSVQREALSDIAKEMGVPPDQLYLMNASNGVKTDYLTGKKVPGDRDISFMQKVLSDRSKDLTIDQSIGQRAVARRLWKKMHGGKEPPSIDEAMKFMKGKDVTYVNPNGDATSYVFAHNLDGYEDLPGMVGMTKDGKINKYLLSNDLHNPAINAASIKHKGVEWWGPTAGDKLARAAEWEALAAKYKGSAKAKLLEKAFDLRCQAMGDVCEGIRQITKQTDNIIVARGAKRAVGNPLPSYLQDLQALGKRVGQDVSPAEFTKSLKKYNLDLNSWADQVSKYVNAKYTPPAQINVPNIVTPRTGYVTPGREEKKRK